MNENVKKVNKTEPKLMLTTYFLTHLRMCIVDFPNFNTKSIDLKRHLVLTPIIMYIHAQYLYTTYARIEWMYTKYIEHGMHSLSSTIT